MIEIYALAKKDFFITSLANCLKRFDIITINVSTQPKVALAEIAHLNPPPIIILDAVWRPPYSISEILNDFNKLPSKPKIILYTWGYSEQVINSLKELGPAGYFHSSQSAEDIVKCITEVSNDGQYFVKEKIGCYFTNNNRRRGDKK